MSEKFTYHRTWESIERMLEDALQEQRYHLDKISKTKHKKRKMFHMRQYKGLQGVIYGRRWTLGDRDITNDILLGRDEL